MPSRFPVHPLLFWGFSVLVAASVKRTRTNRPWLEARNLHPATPHRCTILNAHWHTHAVNTKRHHMVHMKKLACPHLNLMLFTDKKLSHPTLHDHRSTCKRRVEVSASLCVALGNINMLFAASWADEPPWRKDKALTTTKIDIYSWRCLKTL